MSLGERLRSRDILHQAGIVNPERLIFLIQQTIKFLKLDLSGLSVLTEAASGPYVVTPVIAALAGAEQVFALTGNSRYASMEQVTLQTRALENLCGLKDVVNICTERELSLYARADIITNLGFVRPIDRLAVEVMKPAAVVPLMCEAWEYRAGDIDLDACREKKIPVIGTNEDFPGLEVFTYSGWLALKMLFEAGIEIHKSRILLVSSDKFGAVINDRLACAGANVRFVKDLCGDAEDLFSGVDVLITADYTRSAPLIGPDGDLSVEVVAEKAPGISIVQFAGPLDVCGLQKAGVTVYPEMSLGSHRMAQTLAALGPRPVVELHAAGLKIAEMAVRNRREGKLWNHMDYWSQQFSGLGQEVC